MRRVDFDKLNPSKQTAYLDAYPKSQFQPKKEKRSKKKSNLVSVSPVKTKKTKTEKTKTKKTTKSTRTKSVKNSKSERRDIAKKALDIERVRIDKIQVKVKEIHKDFTKRNSALKDGDKKKALRFKYIKLLKFLKVELQKSIKTIEKTVKDFKG